MIDFLKDINNNFAGVLSLVSSIVLVTVTIVYVIQTKRQANYAKQSVDLFSKQMMLEKQPCLVPEIIDSHGYAFDASDYTRIQLGFDINLKNVGESPAINIYALADFELNLSLDEQGNKKVLSAALVPVFVQALSAGDEHNTTIHFETKEIKGLVKELTKSHNMNIQRIKEEPTHHAYHGASIVIRIYYKNLMGQWCESRLSQEICWLEYIDPPKQKTHDLNENTIPPKQIKKGDRFRAVLVSNHRVPFSFRFITEEYANEQLIQYVDESPWLINSISLNSD